MINCEYNGYDNKQKCTWSGTKHRYGQHLLKKHKIALDTDFNYLYDTDAQPPFLNSTKTYTLCFSCGTRHDTNIGGIISKAAHGHLSVCNATKQIQELNNFKTGYKTRVEKLIVDISGNVAQIIKNSINEILPTKPTNEIVHDCKYTSEIKRLKAQIEKLKPKNAIEQMSFDKYKEEFEKFIGETKDDELYKQEDFDKFKLYITERDRIVKEIKGIKQDIAKNDKTLLYNQIMPVALLNDLHKIDLTAMD